ncbi:MAG: Crp/Fnr family transcriptional regulator [Methyloceanibacter sp.]|jgi:CRP-like cAMP-binding protein
MWTDECHSGLAFSGTPTLPHSLLLQSLPRPELDRLDPYLQKVSLTPRRFLQHAGVPIEHLYFVEEGLVSILAKTDERNAVEVGLIGREGAIGSAAILGTRISTLSHFVQIGGSALRIGIDDLDRAMSECPHLRALLHGYLHAALMQSSQSAACNLRHLFLQRLARWLLMAQDRSGLDELPITQDLLARSLGVHRPTVSGAFKLLERRGIFAERGLIRILDRGSLERIACRCHHGMKLRRESWERSKTRRNLLIALSVLGALVEVELLAA